METYDKLQQGERGAWVSIVAYICLAAVKLTIGTIFFSAALRADGWNNTTDIFVSIAVLVGLRISRKPPDHNHRYGHFRAETIATLIASFIMAAVGLQVLIQAVGTFFAGDIRKPEMVTAWTALFCGGVMYGVYRFNRALAAKTGSSAVLAAAHDNRSDAFVSIGAFVGIVGAQLGLNWLDPLAATVVGVIICKTAFDIFRDASHSLSDGFHDHELAKFKKTIGKTPGVRALKEIKARAHGNFVLLDLTILVDHNLNVAESHTITEDVERRMKEKHNIEHVHIHIEPLEEDNERL